MGSVSSDPLLLRVRGLWADLTAVPVMFAPAAGLRVVVSPQSRLCPPSWVGIVVLGDAAIATAPSDSAAGLLHDALSGLPVEALTDPDTVGSALRVQDVLGPATLAYLHAKAYRPAHGADTTEELPPGHRDLGVLLTSAGDADAGESGLAEITSTGFVVRDAGVVVAAAGYRAWPGAVAHLCVLTAPGCRGRGLARIMASAASAHALSHGLLPQWRARPEPSQRLAAVLGFSELGAQLSLRLATGSAAA